MAKVVIKFNNEVIDHVELKQGDMRIGRKPGCDILIDNLAVSGEHANIFTIGEDSFIQDLDSTNGTFINDKKITKHHLRNGDAIIIGKHSLTYLSEAAKPETDDFAKTVIINPAARDTGPAASVPYVAAAPEPAPMGAKGQRQGALLILSGANTGKRIELTRAVTNLGKTGRRAGTITRIADGYVLGPGDGGERPKLNGRPVPDTGARLKSGDIIDVTGTRLQFHLK